MAYRLYRPIKVAALLLFYSYVSTFVNAITDENDVINLLDFEYLDWKLEYNKASTPNEGLHHYRFRQNCHFIETHNENRSAASIMFTMGLNKMADLTPSEIAASRFGFLRPNDFKLLSKTTSFQQGFKPSFDNDKYHRETITFSILPSSVPIVFDWRTEGAVSCVKDQGSRCSSSWAFAAVGALEGRLQILRERSMVELSVQNLLDCSWAFGNGACSGGTIAKAFDYIAFSGGLNTAFDYPYRGLSSRVCSFNNTVSARHGALDPRITYVQIQSGNETALLHALHFGPIAVAVDASPRSFIFYKSGVYADADHCNRSNLNHAMLLVGYGVAAIENGAKIEEVPYWLLKNSWGEKWGESGYIRILRGMNLCGIADHALYPKIASFAF